jgi:AmmeMemoRadiSam system protein B
MIDIRPSPIAGRWYEENPTTLARTVDEYLGDAQFPVLDGDVMGVIAPHAGHQYSGEVAGYSFAALRGLRPDLVVVAGPMHHPYNQPLITTTHAAYSTPLGTIPVDKIALNELDVLVKAGLGFGFTPIARDPEHSLEIELPFLQRVFQHEWKLLPIMVRALEEQVSEGLGKALATVLRDRNFVLVASTDLSHFFKQDTALGYDRAMLGEIENFNPAGAFDLDRARKGFACGLGAFTAVLWAARKLGADKVKVLRHATSANVTGDYSSVVGYGAAAILKSK